ncbi:glycosyl transferase family 2 [Flavobacteriales bacterium 34_180_T64]|nr:glycosyl transferase family 2 [Flavobacteriales bacterium 34_180_T64]
MSTFHFSFIIPVYNRPQEIKELLNSMLQLDFEAPFEIVIIEDGSNIDCKSIVESYNKQLNISYYFKENSGPGNSRNFGMKKAKGNYYIILDSDCLLPKHYLNTINKNLSKDYVDCFGGPDAADKSFTNIQKAINFAMTSFITTGGIRGHKNQVNKFQPRSFNMGLSKQAFESTGGFGSIHPGEDPDLSIRLTNFGFKTKLIIDAYVYHKRRISWSKYYKQVHKFGLVRPILNLWHPKTERIFYWFPSIFISGLFLALVVFSFGSSMLLLIYGLYFFMVFLLAMVASKSLIVALLSIFAVLVQFVGYGSGFIKSSFVIKIMRKKPEMYFPDLFFKHAS